MTILESYREYRYGNINKAQFMERARKDKHLKSFVTNVMTFDDTVRVLKNKGIISEAFQPIPAEIRKGITFELGLTYERTPGWNESFVTQEDVLKVEKKVMKNLEKDPLYYTKLIGTGEKPTGERQKYGIELKKNNFSDTTNKTKSDGYLKKEVKKNEKSNVSDKKENKKGKPAGIKVMPDKGVTGSEKTINEGVKIKASKNQIKEMVKKAMEGAVVTTKAGKLLRGYKSRGEAEKAAKDLKKATGDNVNVQDTQSGEETSI